ncbi:PAS domain S-box protein [Paenibacillus ginsengarvi]|uniref:histidine kinase n=1 Tax=Paenibacillus ginsengarvi TaxID=400777 RepID=A0A3B0CE21_9BACL|nr:PAS domain S-box protein [Paenibacillus ginsengarvi]RKN84023.1 PAS domain S-box protein [Paenibacillus ginsengarvi]
MSNNKGTSTYGNRSASDRTSIEREWEKFMSGSSTPLRVREYMHHSWKRCMEQGIDPFLVKVPYNLGADQIQEYVSSDPQFRMIEPILQQLKQLAAHTGYLVTYCNAAGEMIYYDGDKPLMLKAEDIHFTPGSDWSESSAGTNAIGTALITGMPIQVYASEHFCQQIHSWTCSAAPIRDPATGRICGVLDLTGFWTVNDPRTLDVVTDAGRSIEKLLYRKWMMERSRLAVHYAEVAKRTVVPIAVLDRGGHVVQASRLFYNNGWVKSGRLLGQPSSVRPSPAAVQTWEIEHRHKRWQLEITPYYYGGTPIGSIVTVLPSDIAAFADLPAIRLVETCGLTSAAADSAERDTIPPPRDPLYKSLFEHHPDAIFAYDLRGNLIDANPAAERMLGYATGELAGMRNLVLPEYRDSRLRAFVGAAAGTQMKYEAAFLHKLGHSVKVPLKAFPIIADNKIVGIYETVRDMPSEDVHIQEELKTTKEQLEFYFRNTEDAILVLDTNFHIVKANQSFERIYGWTERELLSKRNPTVPAHLHHEIEEIHNKIITSRHVLPYETLRQRKDGTLIHVSNFISPLFDSKGSVIAYVLISRDITQWKRISEELIESEKRLRTLINAMPDLVIFKDSFGQWIEANDYALALLQLEDAEYKGKTDRELGELRPFFRDMYAQCEVSDQMAWDKGALIRVQETLPNPDGSVVVCDLIKVPIYHSDGSRKGIVAIGRDITELKQTEQLLRKSEKLVIVGQLAAGVAHEIRNPLTTLKGFLSLLRLPSSDKDKWYVDIMQSEIEKMEWVANQFLTVAQPQSVLFKNRNLETIIRHVSTFLYPLAKMHNVEIVVEAGSGNPHVECDESQLKQAFINLVKNSIEAMPQGGQVVIRLEHEASSIAVRVIDHGHGIAKERLPHLGEPFYSLKEKGTGLGLMICFKIVKEHRGTVRIASVVGSGTTVEVRLPLNPEYE